MIKVCKSQKWRYNWQFQLLAAGDAVIGSPILPSKLVLTGLNWSSDWS